MMPAAARFNLAAMAALAAALAVKLWPEWAGDPNLSHGFVAPIACVFLLQESRRAGPGRYLPAGWKLDLAVAALAIAGLATLCIAGLFAVSLAWMNSVVDFTLTAAFVLFAAAAITGFADERIRLVPFNWTSAVAAGIWLLSAPIPTGTAARLTLGLQLWVSENVLHALHVLGIAAHRHGNIIELAAGSVGVEDACSGVRSLVSCIFAGFLFSATLTSRPWARAAVIGIAAPLALAMNFARSLFLTLLVNSGVAIEGAWHDVTGYAVLACTAALLAGIAFALGRAKGPPGPRSGPTPIPGPAPMHAVPRSPGPQVILGSALVLAVAVLAFFRADTRPSPRRAVPAPNLQAILPAHATGWKVENSDDLYRFSEQLRTDRLVQRTYLRNEDGRPVQITLYAAYWAPGQAPVSLVASHTPDACWPGAGWVVHPVAESRATLSVGDRVLPGFPEHRFFTSAAGFPQHVWFWHIFDGRPILYDDPYSPAALLRIALRYGFRKDGDQLFIRISSNRPWGEIAREPLLAEFFSQTRALGL